MVGTQKSVLKGHSLQPCPETARQSDSRTRALLARLTQPGARNLQLRAILAATQAGDCDG